MTEFTQGMLIVIAYRALAITLGFGMAYLGYKLFRVGIYEKAGELKAAWGDKNLTLKQAAPGTFFALFGAFVVIVSLFRGVDFAHDRSRAALGAADAKVASNSSDTPSAKSASAARSQTDRNKPEIVERPVPAPTGATGAPNQTQKLTIGKGDENSRTKTPITVVQQDPMVLIMKKVAEGESLTDAERGVVKQWYETERIHYFAVNPKKKDGEVTG